MIEGDCLAVMQDLEPGSIDLVVTSPPYMTGKVYEDPLTIEEYAEFADAWISLLPRLLSRRGAA